MNEPADEEDATPANHLAPSMSYLHRWQEVRRQVLHRNRKFGMGELQLPQVPGPPTRRQLCASQAGLVGIVRLGCLTAVAL